MNVRRHPFRRLCATVIVAVAVSLACGGVAAAATPKVQYQSAETQFMCVTCHEPLPQVNSPQAQSEKAYLAELVGDGMTMGQIKAVMEQVYGVAVLARPPASGFDALVYVLPPVALVLGLVMLAYTLPKWRARARTAPGVPAAAGGRPALSDEDARRLDEELERFV